VKRTRATPAVAREGVGQVHALREVDEQERVRVERPQSAGSCVSCEERRDVDGPDLRRQRLVESYGQAGPSVAAACRRTRGGSETPLPTS
jgi:hypothetical protein